MTRIAVECVHLPVSEAFVDVGDVVSRGEVVGTNRALVHASTSGRVSSIAPRRRFLSESSPAIHITIEAKRAEDQTEASEFRLPALVQPDSTQIIQRCADAGVVGMGGGGYPTADKLLAARGLVHTLVINLMESDAGVGADAHLARTNSSQLIRGAELAQKAISAEHIVFAAPATLTSTLTEQTDHTVATPGVSEPSGEERRLLKGLFAASIERQERPIDAGYLVLNGATCAAISDAVDSGQTVINRLVRVGTDVLRLPIGTPIAGLIDASTSLRSGSPLSGERLHADACVGKTTYAISEDPRDASSPCIRCGFCRDVCPEPLLPDELIWWRRDNERLDALSVDRCLECGLCDDICPSDIRLTDLIRDGKRRLLSERDSKLAAQASLARVNARNERLAERSLREEARREARLARLAKKRSARTSS
ncbi:MAG: 4Fe-4S dicluster domain-containing protein [Pseudomonadaceae bacterium]|nr:4Fe-4S dicluster domain-containing protein [Pseudomonadaceae bacterium]